MKTNNDKLSFAGVVSLATEDRPQRPMLEVAFKESPTDFFDPVNRVKAQINTTIVREQ